MPRNHPTPSLSWAQTHKQGHSPLVWIVPLLVLSLVTILSPFVDMPIARWFYDTDTHHFVDNTLTTLIYDWWRQLPAAAVIFGSGTAILLSYTRKKWKSWRKPALMLFLTMAIGAGFISHTIFKDHWGRPRPKQVIEFGGTQPFRAIYEPNIFDQPEPSKSFPCGHCTVGFFFFALYFLGNRLNKPLLSYLGLFLAFLFGGTLALTRIVQGGHFFSDTVASAAIMWLTAWLCDWILYGDEEHNERTY